MCDLSPKQEVASSSLASSTKLQINEKALAEMRGLFFDPIGREGIAVVLQFNYGEQRRLFLPSDHQVRTDDA
jgi:hypothetical protein